MKRALPSSLLFLCAIQASGGSDITVRAGQEKPMSPEESLAQIQLDGPYEAQLVAAEPLVLDPVECTWDAQGRLFVADMRDYPLGPPNPGDPWLSRIQLLTDENGDGRMDKAVTFADHLDNVQGLLPYNDGLIATTRTQILFLKDTDGDGKADEIKPLIRGFNPRHSQLQVSAPRWGLDGCVHFNNGLDAKEIYPADDPKAVVNVPRSNFKWDPHTGKIEPTGGAGQYGGAFDDWGHHFYCSNRNPLMFTVMPFAAMMRNPHAGITQNFEDIAPAGAETRVFPLKITHTTADAHAGTNTACCGLGVYRGPLMPELKNNVFVPDPTGQLVTRYKIEPNGASLKATRVGERTEFFRSGDEWCRPVNFTTGPDGAIYICDMYRRWIDHARFFPEEFVKAHDMRQGENHGRIWRVVPKGRKAPKIEAAPKEIEKLVAWLAHENAWQRETAQRLLVAMQDDLNLDSLQQPGYAEIVGVSGKPFKGAVSFAAIKPAYLSENILEKLHAQPVFNAWIGSSSWDSCGSPHVVGRIASEVARGIHLRWWEETLKNRPADGPFTIVYWYLDSHEGVPVQLDNSGRQRILEPSISDARFALLDRMWHYDGGPSPIAMPEDQIRVRARVLNVPDESGWLLKAVLSASKDTSGRVLQHAFAEGFVPNAYSSHWNDCIRYLSMSSVANAREGDFWEVFGLLMRQQGSFTWWTPAVLQGLAEGLPKSGGKLGVRSLSEFVAKPPKGFEDTAKEIGVLLARVDEIIANPKAPLDQRLAVLPLLGQRKWDAVRPVVKELLTDNQPAALSAAALALMRKFPVTSTAPLIYELLPTAGPALKRDLVPLLTANATTALEFFKRMEKGEFPTAWVDVETRWRYQRGNGEMTELAKKLFGEASSDRAAVVKDYMITTTMKGDARKGQAVFATICVACHRHGQLGVDVGPPLSDVKAKPPEALLSDILDPNRMFEARWSAYQIDTKDGRVFLGLITSENSDSVVLAMMGGVKETIQRSTIKEMKSLDRSLMPPGLEAAITKEQMADLLAFLRGS